MATYCKVFRCRYPGSHLSCAHLCGTCKQFGHGQMECRRADRIAKLQALPVEVFPALEHCKVKGCPTPSTHSSEAHHCSLCFGRGHSPSNCPLADTPQVSQTFPCPFCRKEVQILPTQPILFGMKGDCGICLTEKEDFMSLLLVENNLPCGHSICKGCIQRAVKVPEMAKIWTKEELEESHLCDIEFALDQLKVQTENAYSIFPAGMGTHWYLRKAYPAGPLEGFFTDEGFWSSRDNYPWLAKFLKGYYPL